MGPGSLPGYKPRPQKKRTLVYTRTRRSLPTRAAFDYGPSSVPVAQIHARSTSHALWMSLMTYWAWLRPRTIPFAAAVFGMVAVLQSAYYLAHQHDEAEAPYFYIEASPPGQ